MDLKPGYRKTDAGVLPKDWEVRPLGESLVNRPRYGINAAAVPYSDRLPTYIRITDISPEGLFAPTELVSVGAAGADGYFLEEGDLVFARTGASVGKSYRYRRDDGQLVFAGFLIRVRPNPEVLLPSYLSAYATTGPYWSWVRLMSMRSGQPGINGNEYALLPVPHPPLAEQKALASALSDVDALLGAMDRLIAKKRDLKQAAMQQLLTGQTRLPGFSGKWETKRLGDLFVFLRTANNPRADLNAHGEVGYIHYGDIHTTSSAFLDCGSATLPGIHASKVRSAARIEDGDLVMADASEDYAGIGKCVEVRGAGKRHVVAGLHTFLLRAVPTVMAHGFRGYLQFIPAIRESLIRLATGISVYGISKSKVRTIEVSVPAPEEQTAIASVLSDMDAELDALEHRGNKTRLLKHGMMQELLTGKTRLV